MSDANEVRTLTVGEQRIASLPAKHPEPQQTGAAALLTTIANAARDPTVDMDKLERLFAMRKELETEAARRAYNTAMSACQAEMPAVAKNAENTQTRSQYATLDAVAEAITPIYTKHGFNLSFDEDKSPNDGMMRIKCIVGHTEGYEREHHVDIPIDRAGIKGNENKTATHAFGSTMSYGRRYLTLAIFNIATKRATPDNDGNRDDPRITPEQVAELDTLIKELDVNKPVLLQYAKVASLDEIYADAFETVKAVILKKKQQPKPEGADNAR